MASCTHPDQAVEECSRQINEDTRQVTKTCELCGTVISNDVVEVRQW